MRESIFISHATLGENEKGLDNEFVLWLYLQLTGLGYKVWCDLKKFKGGEDFWEDIECEIRSNTLKYLFVLSNNSNHRKGTLKELAVALKIKEKQKDPHFIIPLHIDSALSHDDINIDLIRLNSINFKDGWSNGLARLLERFSDDGVPQPDATDYEAVSNIWQTISLNGKLPLKKQEIYASNWFPIVKFPEHLYFHEFGEITSLQDFPLWKSKFPTIRHKQYFGTFAQHLDFADVIPDFQKYNPIKTKAFEVSKVLQKDFDSDFISGGNAKRILVQLLNISFDRFFNFRYLRNYKLANKRKAYWFEQGVLEKDKVNKVLMIGKMKYGKDNKINWHFGVSSFANLGSSENYFTVNSHIIFTWNGKKLINDDGIQHKCRRKQGKDWWNRHWRDKLLNFMRYFAGNDNVITMNVGSEEIVQVSSIPYDFHSQYGYIDPNERNLPTDDVESEDAIEGIVEELDKEATK